MSKDYTLKCELQVDKLSQEQLVAAPITSEFSLEDFWGVVKKSFRVGIDLDSFKISFILRLEVKTLAELNKKEAELKNQAKDLMRDALLNDLENVNSGLVIPILSSVREVIFDEFTKIRSLGEQNQILLIALEEVAKELQT